MAGRKRIEIDVDEVERLAADGLGQAEIAACLGISADTLGRRIKQSAAFAEAIKRGRERANAEVSNRLFQLCRKGNLGALIWWEKTRKQYTERTEVTGADGREIVFRVVYGDDSPTTTAR